MKPSFSREDIHQGRLNQEAASETPANFAMIDSAPQPRPTRDLDVSSKRTRMAGGFQGQRALELLNNPEASAQADAFVAALNNPKFMRG
tara:strand:+ start:243 stop:509 length:267 start_codon:yes stop_codon:yes gene_type:complete